MHLKNSLSLLCTLPLLCLTLGLAHGQSLTFDINSSTAGVQMGDGTWDTSTANWWNGTSNVLWPNTGADIASFGTNTGTVGGAITVSGTVTAGGLTFNSLSGVPTTIAHTLSGGTIAFADNAVIQAAEFSSNGSSGVQFININSTLTGNGLIMQRDPTATAGAAYQYVRLAGTNPGLTGTLTLKSLNTSHGMFGLIAGAASVSAMSQIIVENGSTLASGGTGQTYANPITIAGTGQNNGAIRIDSSNMIYSGQITLTADAAINTNSSILNTTFSGTITDNASTFGFQRLAATQDSTLTLSGTSNYKGATTLGRSSGIAGGYTTLDFGAATAPVTNLLYNGVTAGALALWGGTVGNTTLTLQGKAATANSQQFGAVTINGTRSNVILSPGGGGTMTMAFGTITHTTTGSVNFISNVAGAITTSTANGLVGTWATLTNTSGTGSWAAASGGVLTSFDGDLSAATGTTLAALPGLSSTSNLRISSASSGNLSTGASLVAVNTVSQADVVAARTLDIGAGNRLRLGAAGGIQMTGGSRDLTIGVAGTAGFLTAGTTTANSAGQVWLTNLSPSSTMTVNSVIDNNGSGVVTLFVNGSGNTVLTGNNLFTGAAQVGSGSLELRNSGALGTAAGATSVLVGASLRLAGDIAIADALGVAGFGTTTEGVIRNLSGSNTLTGLITLNNPTRINSDAGTLTISAATAATNALTGTYALTVGGAGTTAISGRIAIASGTMTKDGAGTLVLSGDNNYTGATTISTGALRVSSTNALGTTAGITSIVSGAALEIIGGTTLAAEPVTLSSPGINNGGGIRNISGDNTLTGLITVSAASRINSDSGTLTLDAASGNALVKDTSASARALTFGGSGNILALDPIARSATAGAGLLSVTKDGNGTLTLRAANTWEGSTTLSAGTMNLDFSASTSPASNVLYNGIATPGSLIMGGGTLLVTGKGSGTTTQAFGTLSTQSGQSYITVDQNGASTVNVNFTTPTRTVYGGVVKFTLPTSGSITTTAGADNVIISLDNIAFATVGTNDWAATDVISGGKRNIVALSSITGGYTPSTANSLAGNADVVTAAVTLTGVNTNTSIRFNTGMDTAVSAGTTLSTGGILVGAGVGAFTSSITGGTLRSSSTSATVGDLVVVQNNTAGDLRITSVIANNATASSVTGLTKAGPGTLALETATHTYTGTTRVLDGTLWVRSGTVSPSTEFTLGSGSNSGKLMLGSGTTAVSVTGDWLRTDGTGTANALVGGGTVLSSFFLDADVTSDFRLGMIGGTGTNENNISINVTSPLAILQLGPSNTFAGKVTNLRGTIEVQTLANAGLPSSLGTGSSSAANAVIDMGTQTTAAAGSTAIATLRYTGSTDSTTDRSIRVANSDAATDIVSVVAVIENAGTGSVKFTSAFTGFGSNTVQRVLRLTGTNTGANEIVGIGDTSGTIITALEKTGTGNWALTGSSSYTGTTSITGGVLQVSSGGTTGTGAVTVGTGSQLVGTGTVKGSSVTLAAGATLQAGAIVTGTTTGNGTLTFAPTSSASYDLQTGSSIVLSATSATNQASIDSTFGGNDIGSAGYNAYVDAISGAGAHDLIIFNGGTGSTLNFAGNLLVSDVNFAPQAGQVFNLLDWGALVTASFASFDTGANYRDGSTDNGTQFDLPSLSGTGLVWDVSRFTTSGNLAIVALVVPEPGRSVLLLAGLAFTLLRRRRTT